MVSFQQKRGFKNIIQSRPVLVLLLILMVFFAYGVVGFMNKMWATEQNRKMAELRLNDLRVMKNKLSLDILKLNTESGMEESIRDKFGLAKEGEGLIVIVDGKNNKSTSVEKDPVDFWTGLFFWKNWFN